MGTRGGWARIERRPPTGRRPGPTMGRDQVGPRDRNARAGRGMLADLEAGVGIGAGRSASDAAGAGLGAGAGAGAGAEAEAGAEIAASASTGSIGARNGAGADRTAPNHDLRLTATRTRPTRAAAAKAVAGRKTDAKTAGGTRRSRTVGRPRTCSRIPSSRPSRSSRRNRCNSSSSSRNNGSSTRRLASRGA